MPFIRMIEKSGLEKVGAGSGRGKGRRVLRGRGKTGKIGMDGESVLEGVAGSVGWSNWNASQKREILHRGSDCGSPMSGSCGPA